MADYRVYIVGKDGNFQSSIALDCAGDDAAIKSAKQLDDGQDIELWQRDRKVATFQAKPKIEF